MVIACEVVGGDVVALALRETLPYADVRDMKQSFPQESSKPILNVSASKRFCHFRNQKLQTVTGLRKTSQYDFNTSSFCQARRRSAGGPGFAES